LCLPNGRPADAAWPIAVEASLSVDAHHLTDVEALGTFTSTHVTFSPVVLNLSRMARSIG
jgi:hypothetical protein